MIVQAHGIRLDVPDGWEARIYRRPHGDPTLHTANFALPVDDGDFGAGAVLSMPLGGEFLCLTEYRPGDGLVPGRGLFAAGPLPLPLRSSHFRPRVLHVARSGSFGLQHFFTEFATNWPGLMAAAFIMSVPVVLMFMLLQKQFVRALTEGAVKS